MSSSRKAHVELRSPLAAVEFSLVDSGFQQVTSGVGALEARVDPGIYQLELRAGPTVESRLLKLGPGDIHRDLGVSLAFPSAAPLEGTSTSHEDQQRAAVDGSNRVAREDGPEAGVVLVVRNVRGQEATPLDAATTRGLTLLDHRLAPVARFRSNWQVNSREGWASWSRRLEPGGYVLRTDYEADSHGRETTIDQSLWLSRGWQTLVFIPNTPHGPATGSASIHMTRLTRGWVPGWDPDSQESGSALELALWGLREGRAVISNDLLRLLLNEKFSNPMLGIVGAHSLLLEPRFNASRFETVTRNLRRLLPDHPDVAALSWLGVEARGRGKGRKTAPFPLIEVAWPPILAASYTGLVRLDALTRGGVVPESVAEAIAANLVVRGVWTSWRALRKRQLSRSTGSRTKASPSQKRARASKTARKTSTAKPKLRTRGSKRSPSAARLPQIDDPAAERVELYVDEVRRVHGVETRAEALETSGRDQVSVATGLPLASVERALDKFGDSWFNS